MRRDQEGRSSEAKRRLLSDLFFSIIEEEERSNQQLSSPRASGFWPSTSSPAPSETRREVDRRHAAGESGARTSRRGSCLRAEGGAALEVSSKRQGREAAAERGGQGQGQGTRARGQSRPLSPRFQASLSPPRLSGPITEIVTKEPHGGGEKESAPGEERGSEKGKRLAAATAAAPSIAAALDDAKNQETANSLEPVSEHDHQRQALALLMGAGRGLGGLF